MWNNRWFGDWFGGWFDGSLPDEDDVVDIFALLGVKEKPITGGGGLYQYNPQIIEDDQEQTILMICNAFLVCHS